MALSRVRLRRAGPASAEQPAAAEREPGLNLDLERGLRSGRPGMVIVVIAAIAAAYIAFVTWTIARDGGAGP